MLSPSFFIWSKRPTSTPNLDQRTDDKSQSATGSNPANISADSGSVLSGTQSQTAKNLFHIARTIGFLCAASTASCDFHSETSMIVPSRPRMIVGDAIGHETFLAQSWNTAPHELQRLLFLPRLGPIRYDNDHSVHVIKIMIAILRCRKHFDPGNAELLRRARFHLTQLGRRARNAT